MNRLETLRYQMLRRVRDFGTAHSDLFDAGSFARQLFADVTAVIIEIENLAATQSSSVSSSRQGTASRAIARAALNEDLEAINLSARAMALSTPGLEDKFRLPRSNGDQALLAAARAFARDAAPLKAEFIRREMPADFLEALASDITHFETSVSTANLSGASQVSATASIDEAIDRGMKAVRELNAVVRNKLRGDRPALAGWTSAHHVERHSSRRSDSKKTDPGSDDSGTHGETQGGGPVASGSNPSTPQTRAE